MEDFIDKIFEFSIFCFYPRELLLCCFFLLSRGSKLTIQIVKMPLILKEPDPPSTSHQNEPPTAHSREIEQAAKNDWLDDICIARNIVSSSEKEFVIVITMF